MSFAFFIMVALYDLTVNDCDTDEEVAGFGGSRSSTTLTTEDQTSSAPVKV